MRMHQVGHAVVTTRQLFNNMMQFKKTLPLIAPIIILLVILLLFAANSKNRTTLQTRASGSSVSYGFTSGSCISSATVKECPLSIPVNGNGTVQFTFTTDNSANKISGAELFFRFNKSPDTDVIAFESYSALGTASPSAYFDTEIIKQVRDFNGAKLLHLTLAAKKPKSELVSQVTVSLTFKGLKNGTTPITFVPEASTIVGPPNGTYAITPLNFTVTNNAWDSSVAIAPYKIAVTVGAGGTVNPTASPTASPSGSITPTGNMNSPLSGQLTIKAKIDGITSMPAVASCKTRDFKVTISGANLTQPVVKTVNMTADANGIYTGTFAADTITGGNTYTVFIKGPSHLQTKFTSVSVASGAATIDLTSKSIPVGDLPVQNGSLTVADMQIVKDNILKTTEAADVNCDGIVNAYDYGLMINSMSTHYDDENL